MKTSVILILAEMMVPVQIIIVIASVVGKEDIVI